MLIRGDSRFLPLRTGCVDAVVTSPPYYGLRDYGTATWVGGDPDCPHRRPAPGPTQNLGNNNAEGTPFKGRCCLCGAERVDKQVGLEQTPDEYVNSLRLVFAELWRVLKPTGTCWLNLGDSYSNTGGSEMAWSTEKEGKRSRGARLPEKNPGLKPKNLVGIPWRTALALQADGWYLRSDIIWSKPNPMTESVTDRPTKSHEYIFLLTKQESYFFDHKAILEPASSPAEVEYTDQDDLGKVSGWIEGEIIKGNGHETTAATSTKSLTTPRNDGERWRMVDGGVAGRGGWRNKRTVWTVPTSTYKGSHFATFPEELIKPCILAGSPIGGLVLDPFVGSGTTVEVAQKMSRRGVGVDLGYQQLSTVRTGQMGLRFDLDA